MGVFTRCLATAASCTLVLGFGPSPSAVAAPTQVTLHLDGTHPVGVEYHQGTFTASSPLCPAGNWIGNGAGSRDFTCSDGSGSFTASFRGELEHSQGATGPWTIFHGAGAYETLRGQGTATIDFSTGEQVSPITFRDTWTGVVDFDVTAPTGSVTATQSRAPADLARPLACDRLLRRARQRRRESGHLSGVRGSRSVRCIQEWGGHRRQGVFHSRIPSSQADALDASRNRTVGPMGEREHADQEDPAVVAR
jgi:hypothetical protein